MSIIKVSTVPREVQVGFSAFFSTVVQLITVGLWEPFRSVATWNRGGHGRTRGVGWGRGRPLGRGCPGRAEKMGWEGLSGGRGSFPSLSSVFLPCRELVCLGVGRVKFACV